LIGSKIGHSLDPLLMGAYRVMFLGRSVSPNTLTVCGLFLSLVVFYLVAAHDQLLAAGLLLIASGFLDLLDGAVARKTNTVNRFGGFLDSVLDRYSDLLVMFGICVHFLRLSDQFYSMATFFAAIGVAIVPYARARAEAASIACSNGVLERPERVILLTIGLVFDVLRPVVLIIAVLAHVTVFQRVWLVRKASSGR
jgi:CDP-diacylglycerol--glycerol-3-phosphate 3-phosphatidyltransferase